MSNAWEDIKNVRSFRDRMAQKKQERQNILNQVNVTRAPAAPPPVSDPPASSNSPAKPSTSENKSNRSKASTAEVPSADIEYQSGVINSKVESKLNDKDKETIKNYVLMELDDPELELPLDAVTLSVRVQEESKIQHPIEAINKLLLEFETQFLLVTENNSGKDVRLLSVNHQLIMQQLNEKGLSRKRTKSEQQPDTDEASQAKRAKVPDKLNIETLLNSETAKEKETKKLNEEIQDLLNIPSVKEQLMSAKFKSQGGTMKEFCSYGTRADCQATKGPGCDKVHFRRIIHKHTDVNLGDCSFLNTCFHMDTCKYIHYEVDQDDLNRIKSANMSAAVRSLNKNSQSDFKMMEPQWVQCDMRKFDMKVLGKFAVIMADPPWDIHMELPYGTMSDDEMRALDIPCLQDEGYIFLWVTGRAMELGRECLELWGYRRCDELIWVKTNQLQKLIRTGRTGHWLNHGKEHCLIGVKGNPQNMNRGLDCDVIVAEVRATSHKPDEIYGVIERLSPGTRKIELFGRPHNIQPNWITLGNQLDGVQLHEEDVKRSFKKRYPDGKCI